MNTRFLRSFLLELAGCLLPVFPADLLAIPELSSTSFVEAELVSADPSRSEFHQFQLDESAGDFVCGTSGLNRLMKRGRFSNSACADTGMASA